MVTKMNVLTTWVITCIIVCTTITFPSASDIEEYGTIIVTLLHIRSEQGGTMIVTLYNGKKDWLDLKKALKKKIVPVSKDSIYVTFENIPFDSTYAIQVIHDANKNGKLDFRIFPLPKPKEGAGVSNNNVRNGPPQYKKATIRHFNKSTGVDILMRY